jgi:WhiB family redox-sensing transcriptional regulator
MAHDSELLEDRTDDELADLARHRRVDAAGARAVEILLERYRRQRFSLAHRYGKGVDVDDLVQEAALALMRAVDTHRPERGPIGPWIWQWMWGATLRAAKERWSSARTVHFERTDIELLDDGSTTVAEFVVDALMRDQDREAIFDALRRLSDGARQALLDPHSHQPSARRTALAMLRHPSVRPVVDDTPTRAGIDNALASSVLDGEDDARNRGLSGHRVSWILRAACRGASPDLFWGGVEATRRQAIELCAGCAVRRECLLDALALPAGGGIRAGTSEKERRILKQQVAETGGGAA